MRFQGAVIKEQGIKFAIAVVKKWVIDDKNEAHKAIKFFQNIFSGMPVVLMAQDYRGNPVYYGRSDISRFMANVPLRAIPWKEYSLSYTY